MYTGWLCFHPRFLLRVVLGGPKRSPVKCSVHADGVAFRIDCDRGVVGRVGTCPVSGGDPFCSWDNGVVIARDATSGRHLMLWSLYVTDRLGRRSSSDRVNFCRLHEHFLLEPTGRTIPSVADAVEVFSGSAAPDRGHLVGRSTDVEAV